MKRKIQGKKRFYSLCFIVFVAVALLWGVKSTYAYYNEPASFSMIASRVGDFYYGNAHVNIMLYKETGTNSGIYNLTNSLPTTTFKEAKCYTPKEPHTSIDCTNGTSGKCYYQVTPGTKVSLTSSQDVTCKFYFAA